MDDSKVKSSDAVTDFQQTQRERPMRKTRKPMSFDEKYNNLPVLKSRTLSSAAKCTSCRETSKKSKLIEVEIKSKKCGVRKILKCENCLLKAGKKVQKETPVSGLEFCCDVCGTVKKSKALIRNHVESHLKLSCEACGAVLSSRGQLLQHLSKHFKNFVCQFCGQNFNFIEKLKKHLRKNHDPKFIEEKEKKRETVEKGSFPCRFCPYVLNNKVSLLAHEYRLHKDGKSEFQFKCEDCDKGFYTKEDFRLHSFQHFTGKVRHCEFPGCTKFFKTGKLLGIHKKTHLPPKHECLRCGAKFVQSSGLLKHNKRFCKYQKPLKALPPAEETEKISEIAKSQFEKLRVKKPKVQSNSLLLEVIKVQDEVTNFIDIKEEPINDDEWEYEYLDEAIEKIEVDEELPQLPVVLISKLHDEEIQKWIKTKEAAVDSFEDFFELPIEKKRKLYNGGKRRKVRSSQGSQKFHIPRVKRQLKPGEIYTCDMCGNKYNNWMSIVTHVTTVHKPVGDLPCHFCPKLFKSSCNLKRHIESIHEKIRSHVCHVCGSAFSSNNKLKHHLKIHDEPEECKICGKFVTNLKDHVKRHNKSVSRTFLACPTCGKLYDKYVLQMHIDRVHGKSFNGRIFRCDDCDINFTRQEDWRQHSYTTHFDSDIHKCQKCDKVFRTKKMLRYHRHTHDPAGVECKVCGKTFSRHAGLYKHRKVKHAEEESQQEAIEFETEIY